jgi:hypothetical protein
MLPGEQQLYRFFTNQGKFKIVRRLWKYTVFLLFNDNTLFINLIKIASF